MIKVCILTTVHPVFNIRVFYKEGLTLLESGYDVAMIAQHHSNEVAEGIRIIALPISKSYFHRIFSLTLKCFLLALRERADVYHFHDPELLPFCFLLKLFTGRKVIYDVHEDYSGQILEKDWLGNILVRKIVVFVVNIVEHLVSLFIDGIVVATPAIGRKFDKSKTVLVRNVPRLVLVDKAVPLGIKKEKPVVVYVGELYKGRKIKEIIQAMEFIGTKGELWLLGDWKDDSYRIECQCLKGWRYVKYFGFLKIENLYGYIKAADIGICLSSDYPNYLEALPNKIFEYMACSLPMVISDLSYWRDTFKECALFTDSGNSKDIAEKIDFLLRDGSLNKRLGAMGRELIEKKYSWENESKKLLDLYKNLLR